MLSGKIKAYNNILCFPLPYVVHKYEWKKRNELPYVECWTCKTKTWSSGVSSNSVGPPDVSSNKVVSRTLAQFWLVLENDPRGELNKNEQQTLESKVKILSLQSQMN